MDLGASFRTAFLQPNALSVQTHAVFVLIRHGVTSLCRSAMI
jgi:hypothetical protein